MGSPNFSVNDFVTLGITPNIAEQYHYHDEIDFVIGCYTPAKKLVDVLNRFVSCNYNNINPLADFGNQLVTFELEHGYQDGFRIVIATELADETDLLNWYDDHHTDPHGDPEPCGLGSSNSYLLPAGMTFGQFKNCYYKALDFCQYALIELENLTPLACIAGGWTGGEYTPEPNTTDNHKRFKSYFAELLEKVKNANLFFN